VLTDLHAQRAGIQRDHLPGPVNHHVLAGHRSFYAQVEHARQAISVERAFAIANVLGVEMTELFTDFPTVPHARPY
jgi:transcriptional regulator with XRE-family HTH domain